MSCKTVVYSHSLIFAAQEMPNGISCAATGNRQQATGNRQQATGNRQQATGNRQQATGNTSSM